MDLEVGAKMTMTHIIYIILYIYTLEFMIMYITAIIHG